MSDAVKTRVMPLTASNDIYILLGWGAGFLISLYRLNQEKVDCAQAESTSVLMNERSECCCNVSSWRGLNFLIIQMSLQ